MSALVAWRRNSYQHCIYHRRCWSCAIPKPPNDIFKLISLLAWTSTSEVKEYYNKLDDHVSKTLEADQQREKWKQHSLYETYMKEELEQLCGTSNIPVTPLSKHQLVSLQAESRGESEPTASSMIAYLRKLVKVPKTITALNCLPSSKASRNTSPSWIPSYMGIKDQLVVIVRLLTYVKTAALCLDKKIR